MQYPEFFNTIEPIQLQDDLANLLGAFDEGIMEFNYLDVVKCAGHSCPTVLGAYLMTAAALKELYKDELPKRGEVKIYYKENQFDGVAGVIANVMANITGATSKLGFKGIAGNFDRRHLMFFEEDIPSNVRFLRRDTKEAVDVYYDASIIAPDANMSPLMQKCLSKTATQEEAATFAKLWQARVEAIALNKEKVIKVEAVAKD